MTHGEAAECLGTLQDFVSQQQAVPEEVHKYSLDSLFCKGTSENDDYTFFFLRNETGSNVTIMHLVHLYWCLDKFHFTLLTHCMPCHSYLVPYSISNIQFREIFVKSTIFLSPIEVHSSKSSLYYTNKLYLCSL